MLRARLPRSRDERARARALALACTSAARSIGREHLPRPRRGGSAPMSGPCALQTHCAPLCPTVLVWNRLHTPPCDTRTHQRCFNARLRSCVRVALNTQVQNLLGCAVSQMTLIPNSLRNRLSGAHMSPCYAPCKEELRGSSSLAPLKRTSGNGLL